MNSRPVFFRISRNRRKAASAPSMRPKALSGSIAKYSRGLALAGSAALLAVSALLSMQSAKAADAIWNNAGTDWGTAANWTNGLPSTTQPAEFSTLTMTNQPVIASGASVTAEGIWLNTGLGAAVTITGVTTAGTLNLTGDATINGNATAGIVLDDSGNFGLTIGTLVTTKLTNSQTFYVNNASTLLFNGSGTLNLNGKVLTLGGTNASGIINIAQVISGTTSSLVVNTAGTVTLSNTNTFTGGATGVTLTAGVLNLNAAKALGAAANTFAINGGTVDNTGGVAVLTNTGAITWGGNFAYGGTNNLTIGTSAAAITNAGDRTITLNGTAKTLTFGGKMTNSEGTLQTTTVNGAGNTLSLGAYDLSNSAANYIDVITGTGNVAITGIVANGSTSTASGLTYSGTGTLTLGGASTFIGGVSLNNGTLGLGASSVVTAGALVSSPVGTGTFQVGTASQAVTLSTNVINTTTRTVSNAISLNNDVTFTTSVASGRIALNVVRDALAETRSPRPTRSL